MARWSRGCWREEEKRPGQKKHTKTRSTRKKTKKRVKEEEGRTSQPASLLSSPRLLSSFRVFRYFVYFVVCPVAYSSMIFHSAGLMRCRHRTMSGGRGIMS